MLNRTSGWTTWNPWADVAYLQDRLDRLFQDAFGVKAQTTVYTLPVDVFDKGEEIIVQAFVPGMRAEHLDIQVDNGVLTISGMYPVLYDTDEARNYTWYARELRSGRFQRSIAFPVKVDFDHATAEIRDGVLRMVFPKAPEAKPRRIQISEASAKPTTAQLTELASQSS